MKNADQPIHPQPIQERIDDEVTTTQCVGLNKREYFAAMAMSGLAGNMRFSNTDQMVDAAVEIADAILKKLES